MVWVKKKLCFWNYYESINIYCWRRQWHPTPALLPGKSHGWRSLVGYSPWGSEELDTTERLHFHFSLSCIGEGNGNPLQCSCLENLRDRGAWWAAVYGVTQSRTWWKQLSMNTTVQKHQFFSAQLSSQSNSRIHTWPLEKPQPWLNGPLLA